METTLLTRVSDFEWRIEAHGKMRVPVILYASEELVREMDMKVYEQAVNVATLPGIQKAAYAMPDAHWGYGFPIESRPSILKKAALSRLAGSASISPAAYARC